MVAQCRARLSVRPKKAHAILFYSQHPDGSLDRSSKHGGCPVLKGTKWAAAFTSDQDSIRRCNTELVRGVVSWAFVRIGVTRCPNGLLGAF